MKSFFLDLDADIQGIYLSTEMIDLLSIIQCNSADELRSFAENCPQLVGIDPNTFDWSNESIEAIKQNVFRTYQGTIVSLKESIEDKKSVIINTLKNAKIPEEEFDEYVSQLNGAETKGQLYAKIGEMLYKKHPQEYAQIAERQQKFIATERDQIKDVSYEEMCVINNKLKDSNTILVAAARYYDVRNKLYREDVPNGMPQYDFEMQKRGLDFCVANGMKARYHALLDKQTRETYFNGMDTDAIKSELRKYVEKSIDFINQYNQDHHGTITSVDLFNEIISFPHETDSYKNMWNEMYGILTEDIVDVFQYALQNKPDGVTYVYNEPFLEDKDRREAVIKQLEEINEVAERKYGKPLVDTLGTQMHITMKQDIGEIRKCFEDLKKLQDEKDIKIQITEFDMCMPNEVIFDQDGKIRSENEIVTMINNGYGLNVESVAEFKKMKMKQIADAIRDTDVELEGVSYWSVSDTLDHNLERTNAETFGGKKREVAKTRYAGLYSYQEKEQERTDFLHDVRKTAQEQATTDGMRQAANHIRNNIEQDISANVEEDKNR